MRCGERNAVVREPMRGLSRQRGGWTEDSHFIEGVDCDFISYTIVLLEKDDELLHELDSTDVVFGHVCDFRGASRGHSQTRLGICALIVVA